MFAFFLNRALAEEIQGQKKGHQTLAQDILDAQTRHEALHQMGLDPDQAIVYPFSWQLQLQKTN